LHVIGNLHRVIGSIFGDTDYMRNRGEDSGTKALSKRELVVMIYESQSTVQRVLPTITENVLEKEYTFDFLGKHTAAWYLYQFLLHFQYHLGQINYHRILIAN
jgi:hypothetical protein